ncbi:mechanosensitive ion channel family protein [Luteolibacter marinus]|uniref:mechanosensitive ion channel family protein n=1 Tax=Luteolibacter marinus TaxID=2776705 RepID=UPI0018667EE7|nr:mechanosensitive ion channel family protein [Luteolibacter marinus]
MRARHLPLLAFLFLASFSISCLAADPPAPVTTGDPGVSNEILALKLDPLTKEELASEADGWQALLKEKAQAIADAEIASRTSVGEAREAQLKLLPGLREEKDALLSRFNTVLKAYELKGGDPGAYRKYEAAVSGIKAEVTDVSSTWHAFTGWLTSKEGGIKWGLQAVKFVAVLLAFWLIAGIASKLVSKVVDRQEGLSGLLKNFIKKMTRRVILLVGLLIALGTVGVNVGAALALIGGGAFILAFALQDTLSNFAAGMMLMIYRPFDVGDAVEIGGVTGKVNSVSLVSTTICTFDNKKVLVPNKKVWGEVITNITGNPTRRVDLVFGIGYDDDMDKAQSIIERVVAEHALVLEDPAPVIKLNELADSSVNFICRPWTKTGDYLTVLSDITKRVKTEFDAAGISIPYPQRDVHLIPAPAGDKPAA